ncbi:MAG TPA: MiaB/RimO family radical SAM methylthiotransferase [Deltaproteobacteria bacterium]|jgi:threonylcarbamoyladenosine tRNA methylthiotransferase MtaB|nr:MiaB/RimO family radical SAM methylthiotransferase [Deltaproteobacteria bacterium]HQJ07510.1 MiaB/RimO family radical SAM methylthiotransferase [Deltaproteobacteria bacterium]
MKFAITTLGCKVNQYESQLIREALKAGGYDEQDFSLPGADLYIINTCTVTHRSDAEDRRLMRKALAFSSRIIVTGCQAAVYPGEIRGLSERIETVPFDQLESVLGVPFPKSITDFADHSRAFVNIQQGCDNRCTFCIVPSARGTPRSRPLEEIIHEISRLFDSGFREIVLTGINIGLYDGGIPALMRKILERTPMPRVRISSIEPWTLTSELISMAVNEPRICRHLHLPLQSGSDEILSRMGRPYQAGYYRDLVSEIRSSSRDIAIGSDIMVGFPGESEEQFRETFSLLEDLDIAYLHVFPFSPRPGTPAASYPGQVDARIVKDRASRLRNLSKDKRRSFIRSQIGKPEEVLVTHSSGNSFKGITSNYITVEAQGKAEVNDRVKIVFEESCEGYARGRTLG